VGDKSPTVEPTELLKQAYRTHQSIRAGLWRKEKSMIKWGLLDDKITAKKLALLVKRGVITPQEARQLLQSGNPPK
jgi:hypothetical protein